jgi:hypothetical protein
MKDTKSYEGENEDEGSKTIKKRYTISLKSSNPHNCLTKIHL